jgi:hypothetical protein
MFPSSGEKEKTATLFALSKGPNRAGVFSRSAEYGNRSSFQNVVVSSYLEFRTLDKAHKPSDSEGHTPPSGPFRFCDVVR